MSPKLIPVQLLDELWSRGICNGVNDAVGELHPILDITDVEVEIRRFSISEAWETLSEGELQQLGRELRTLSRELVHGVLAAQASEHA